MWTSSIKKSLPLYIPLLKMAWPALLALQIALLLSNFFFDELQQKILGRESIDYLLLSAFVFGKMSIDIFFSSLSALIVAGGLHLLKQRQSWLELFNFAIHHLNQMIIESVRSTSAVIFRLPLLIIPALVEVLRLCFVPYVVLFDANYASGHVDALKRSRSLAKQHMTSIGVFLSIVGIGSGISSWLIADTSLLTQQPVLVLLAQALTLLLNTFFGIIMFSIYESITKLHDLQP